MKGRKPRAWRYGATKRTPGQADKAPEHQEIASQDPLPLDRETARAEIEAFRRRMGWGARTDDPKPRREMSPAELEAKRAELLEQAARLMEGKPNAPARERQA